MNERIRVPEVRVIGDDGEHTGVMPTADAIALAQARGLDLVEINPKAQPPICKIVEYGSFKYNQEKQERQKRVNAKATEVKGVRISARIGEHDKEIRLKRAIGFLKKGNKVKVELILRGRENSQRERAADIVKDFIKSMQPFGKIIVEQEVKRQGNKFTALVAGTIEDVPVDEPQA